jgi:hypothetical protein
MNHVGRFVGPATEVLRREEGRVGLHEQELGGHVRGGALKVGRLRVRDVAGERAEVAALHRLVEAVRRREAVKDHRREVRRVVSQDGEGVLLGRASVDRHRQAQPGGELELGLEGAALVGARSVVAVIVEAGFAEGPDLGVGGPALDLVEVGGPESLRVVWVETDDREHALMPPGRLEGARHRGRVCAHGRQPREPSRARPLDQLPVRRVAVVEVAVGVDHGRGAGACVMGRRATAPRARRRRPTSRR